MIDHSIELDDAFAQKIEFTLDRFLPGSYLWRKGNTITISFIMSRSPGKGDFSRLLRAIESLGFDIEVPTPMGKMLLILAKKGFQSTLVESPEMGTVEVWRKPGLVEVG